MDIDALLAHFQYDSAEILNEGDLLPPWSTDGSSPTKTRIILPTDAQLEAHLASLALNGHVANREVFAAAGAPTSPRRSSISPMMLDQPTGPFASTHIGDFTIEEQAVIDAVEAEAMMMTPVKVSPKKTVIHRQSRRPKKLDNQQRAALEYLGIKVVWKNKYRPDREWARGTIDGMLACPASDCDMVVPSAAALRTHMAKHHGRLRQFIQGRKQAEIIVMLTNTPPPPRREVATAISPDMALIHRESRRHPSASMRKRLLLAVPSGVQCPMCPEKLPGWRLFIEHCTAEHRGHDEKALREMLQAGDDRPSNPPCEFTDQPPRPDHDFSSPPRLPNPPPPTAPANGTPITPSPQVSSDGGDNISPANGNYPSPYNSPSPRTSPGSRAQQQPSLPPTDEQSNNNPTPMVVDSRPVAPPVQMEEAECVAAGCAVKFRTAQDCITHYRMKHGRETYYLHCPLQGCDMVYPIDFFALVGHLRRAHNEHRLLDEIPARSLCIFPVPNLRERSEGASLEAITAIIHQARDAFYFPPGYVAPRKSGRR